MPQITEIFELIGTPLDVHCLRENEEPTPIICKAYNICDKFEVLYCMLGSDFTDGFLIAVRVQGRCVPLTLNRERVIEQEDRLRNLATDLDRDEAGLRMLITNLAPEEPT